MKTAINVTRGLLGFMWLTQLVLGVLFWTGHALTLVSAHTTIGYLFVLGLWTLAVLCARAGAPRGLVAVTLLWGLILPGLGVMQVRLLPGAAHWIIRVLHLAVGVAAMGLVGAMTARARGTKAHADVSGGAVMV